MGLAGLGAVGGERERTSAGDVAAPDWLRLAEALMCCPGIDRATWLTAVDTSGGGVDTSGGAEEA